MKKGLLVGLMVLAFIVSFASTGLAKRSSHRRKLGQSDQSSLDQHGQGHQG